MNRDRFRFRVRHKNSNIYHYDAEYTYDFMNGKPVILEDCFGDLIDNDDYILEQCTGLRDKNGNLIYEGDVVLDISIEAIVRWYSDRYLIKYDNGSLETLASRADKLEVIGNVHDDRFRDLMKTIENRKGNK